MTSELSLEFMTGNPQLGVLSGRLRYINTNGSAASKEEDGEDEGEEDDEEETVENGRHAKVLSTSSVSPTDLPEHRGTILCILSVPAHMIPTDILQFVAPFKRHVHFVRILRPCNPVGPSDPARTPTEYMVLLQMENQASADDLYLQCNGKRFNSFEEARCRVVFVATATFELGATGALPAPGSPSVSPSGGNGVTAVTSSSFPSSSPVDETALTVSRPGDSIRGVSPGEASIQSLHPAVRFSSVGKPHSNGGGVFMTGATGSGDLSAAGTQDWSTCVICMDRMECHVLTTVCNHSFHVECLVKWQDSPCPVCRYHHNNASEASTCQECQASDNLWVCLICGDVLCGSRHLDHVRLHYTSTLHAYALDIETQQVWDFAGDGFVHRLIHNKADGKLVEIPDPRQTSEERPQFPARLSDVQEERLIHGKLEGLAYQYNTLLTSQLDEQRHFYEKQ